MPTEHENLVLYRLDELKENIAQLRADVRTWHNDHEKRLRAIEQRPQGNSRLREFWASLIALAMSFVALAGTIWKSMR